MQDVVGRTVTSSRILNNSAKWPFTRQKPYRVKYTFDDNGQITAENIDGATTTYERDAAGSVTSMVDPMGLETDYTYNSDENLTGEDFADGSFTTYTYSGFGLVGKVYTDALGNTTDWAFDGKSGRS